MLWAVMLANLEALEVYCSPIGIQTATDSPNHCHIGWARWLIWTPEDANLFLSQKRQRGWQVEKDGKGISETLPPTPVTTSCPSDCRAFTSVDDRSVKKAEQSGEGLRARQGGFLGKHGQIMANQGNSLKGGSLCYARYLTVRDSHKSELLP